MAKVLVDIYKNIIRCDICGILKTKSIECNYSNCEVLKKSTIKYVLLKI